MSFEEFDDEGDMGGDDSDGGDESLSDDEEL